MADMNIRYSRLENGDVEISEFDEDWELSAHVLTIPNRFIISCSIGIGGMDVKLKLSQYWSIV